MRSLSAPITTEVAAQQSAFTFVYDFYLKKSITTPVGVTDKLRLTECPGGLSFFLPVFDPEPAATQGDAQTYSHWPIGWKVSTESSRSPNDKLAIEASNVTTEFAQMLADVEWRETPVVIRQVSLNIAAPTENDYITVFNGRIDQAKILDKEGIIHFTCSNGAASLNTVIPRENMHTGCRFRWGDDLCTALRFASANYKHKTAGAGSTTTIVKASYAGYTAQAVTADAGTDKLTLAAHTLLDGHRVRVGGTTVPTGLTRGRWYYVVNKATNDFELSLTRGGAKVDLTSAGSGVTIDSETGFAEDTGNPPYVAQAVTIDSATDKVGLAAHVLQNGDQVRFAATVIPGGLTAGTWYYVVNKAVDDFKVSLTKGGAAIDITSNGTAVTIDSTAPYGADIVDALADGSISESSYQTGYEGYRVKTSHAAADHWRFSDTPSNPTPAINIYGPHVQIDFSAAQNVAKWTVTNGPVSDPDYYRQRKITVFGSSDATTWVTLQAAQTPQPGDPQAVIVIHPIANFRYYRVQVERADGGPLLYVPCGKIYAYATGTSSTDLIDPLADGAFTASSEKAGNEAKYVQSGVSGTWKLDHTIVPADFNEYDWGSILHGYWQIKDTQAGLKNAALKPYVQFDFGSAKQPFIWRFKALDDVERQDIPRLILIFSSTDAAAWTFQSYFELPPRAGQTSDCLIHGAASARYWRVCVRSTWAEVLNFKMFNKVMAHEAGRNWWAHGFIRFDASTTTAALRGVLRPIIASYNGELHVSELPAAPASGDWFTVERGCAHSFNACAEKQNTENFGGFNTLPDETVIRQ